MINQTAVDTTDETEELLTPEVVSDIKKKSLSGVTSYFFRTSILQGIGLLSALVLSAFFSPEDFGVFGFVTQIIGLLIFFSDVGLAASLIQKKTKPTELDYRTAFTVQQLLSWVIFGIILLVIWTGFVQEKTGPAGVWILVALGLSFPLATLKTIPSVMLERSLNFSKLVLPQIFEQLFFHGILIILAVSGQGAMAYAYAVIARSLVGVISMYLIKPWRIGFSLDKQSLASLLNFGLKFQLNDFLARIKDQLFFLVLGVILPLREFGYIQWSKNWSMYPYNLTVQNVMAITFPTFSRLQSQKLILQKAVEKSLFFISSLIFPILVGMSVFIWPLLQLVPQYAKWEPAVPTFILFTLSIGWAAISSPLVNTLNAIGEINISLKLMTLWTSLTWILTPIFLWWFGFNGVAVASLIISFTSFLPIIYVKRYVTIEVWDQVWRQLLAAALMAGVGIIGLQFWSTSFTNLVIGFIATTSTYLAVFFMTGKHKIQAELASIGLDRYYKRGL